MSLYDHGYRREAKIRSLYRFHRCFQSRGRNCRVRCASLNITGIKDEGLEWHHNPSDEIHWWALGFALRPIRGLCWPLED